LIEKATGGTMHLDEIGELNHESQVKLLRLLQEGEYYPVGSDQVKRAKARFVLATNQDLIEKQQLGQFRKDFFYRLQTHHIDVPPLRERREDIPVLLEYFAREAAAESGGQAPEVPKQIAALLANYDFPGNVRELRSMVYDEVSRGKGTLSVDGFRSIMAGRRSGEAWPDVDRPDEDAIFRCFLSARQLPTYAETEEILTDAALQRADGNQTLAARMLGISQPGLSKRLNARKQDRPPRDAS
jgi:DNA-binding NtrC family response regulator